MDIRVGKKVLYKLTKEEVLIVEYRNAEREPNIKIRRKDFSLLNVYPVELGELTFKDAS